MVVGYMGAHLTAQQQDFNTAMSGVRISVEWLFGDVVRNFAFLDWKKNLKVWLQPVAKYYLVGALFTNCRACLYGNSTSAFFGLSTPNLGDYLRGAP